MLPSEVQNMNGSFASLASLLIFVATYLLISFRKIGFLNVDRPTVGLIGGTLMVLLGIVPFNEAFRGGSDGGGISWETISLLLGMMVIVGYLKLARFFEYVSTWILIRSGNPRRLLALLILCSGLLSALFVNDTICVLFTPILLGAALRAGLNPVPYLIALATSANIGSVMTLTGNPQNMLVGIFSKIPYGTFFVLLMPVAAIGMVLDWAILRWLYRRDLEGTFKVEGLTLPEVDRSALRRILAVVAIVTGGFLLPLERWIPGMDPSQKLPVVALAGAGLAVLSGRCRPSQAFSQVDWGLLVFFSGLFIVISGINRTGILPALHARAAPFFGPGGGTLTVFTVVLSNLVSNVPYVLAVQKWINGNYEWTLVAMASTLAGNLTIVGSVANMIVLELSREAAKIGWLEYLKAGIPVTVATTLAGYALLRLFHAAAWL